MRLLSENINILPDDDKNTEDIQSLTAMIGYVQQNYANKILLKNISTAGTAVKPNVPHFFKSIWTHLLCYT